MFGRDAAVTNDGRNSKANAVATIVFVFIAAILAAAGTTANKVGESVPHIVSVASCHRCSAAWSLLPDNMLGVGLGQGCPSYERRQDATDTKEFTSVGDGPAEQPYFVSSFSRVASSPALLIAWSWESPTAAP